MSYEAVISSSEDWRLLLSFLPEGWEDKARELKALRRGRKLRDAESLLRALLMHLGTGDSLRTTAVQIREGGLADISDVGLLKRVRNSGDWFLWMAQQLRERLNRRDLDSLTTLPGGYVFRAVDGTTVEEPGATGTTCRIHYSFDLLDLYCSEAVVTTDKTAEGLANFKIQRNEVLIGDRAYSTAKGIAYVLNEGGQVVVRIKHRFLLYNEDGGRFQLLPELSRMKIGETRDWRLKFKNGEQVINCRLCAVKKSPVDAEKSVNKILRNASKKGHKPRPETLECAKYVIIVTTLDADLFSAPKVLEIYRRRWQVELMFKRLKSLLQLGHLKKFDQQAIRAWLHGKLFLACLLECFARTGETFFPWGYPIAVDS